MHPTKTAIPLVKTSSPFDSSDTDEVDWDFKDFANLLRREAPEWLNEMCKQYPENDKRHDRKSQVSD